MPVGNTWRYSLVDSPFDDSFRPVEYRSKTTILDGVRLDNGMCVDRNFPPGWEVESHRDRTGLWVVWFVQKFDTFSPHGMFGDGDRASPTKLYPLSFVAPGNRPPAIRPG